MRSKLLSFSRPAALAVAALAVFGCTQRPFVPVHGDPEGTALETFVQTENTSATILWVIDNSGSMCEEQFNVRSNLQSFISSFLTAAPGATFHMGVTTTDTSNVSVAGRLQNSPQTVVASPLCPTPPPPLDCTTGLPSPLPKWVDDATPDIERTFGCISSVGIMGFGGETALGGARMALSPTLLADPMANAGFFIDGSLLVIIFLGDEDDCTVCSGSTCAPLPGLQFNLDCSINRVNELTPINDFVSYIQSLSNGSGGTVGDSVLVAAIIGLDPMGNSMGPVIADPGGADSLVPICSVAGQGSAAPAPRIEGFTRGFNDHLEFSICDTDYGPELATIGSRIGSLLQSGCLQHPPCPGVVDEQVVVRVISNGMTTELSPDQYDIVCAGGTQTCPNSADATCGPDGWRIDFLNPALVPPGATVEVHYAFDTGDGCVAE